MSTMSYSTFYLGVQRKFNDYTPYTLDLIKEVTAQRISEMQSYAKWPELTKRVEFTAPANTRTIYLSGLGSTYKTEGIITLRDGASLCYLQKMSQVRYNELISDPSSEKDQPNNWVPITDNEFYLYPYPTTARIMTMFIQVKHLAMTATSQVFDFTDERVNALKYAVIADIMEDKDDTRFQIWEGKYQRALRCNRGDLLRNGNSRLTLMQGSSIE